MNNTTFSAQFFTALTALLKAGVPLVQSIEIFSNQQEKRFQSLLLSLKHSLTEGLTLSDTLSKFPRQFDILTLSLIKAGEASGTLVSMLEKISQYQEKNALLKSRLQKALFYPVIVLCIAVMLSSGLLIFVVPQFETLFVNANKALPRFTQFILSLSFFFQHHFMIILGCFFLALCLNSYCYYFHKNSYVNFLSALLLKMPFLKIFYQKILLSRFSFCLSLLLSSGIPMKNALTLSADVLSQKKYTKAILWVKDRVLTGEKLSLAFEKTRLFPLLFLQLLQVGEQAGQLPTFLSNISILYDAQSDKHLHKLTLMLEPFIMIILGIIIGGLVIGMYLPIFQLGNTLS